MSLKISELNDLLDLAKKAALGAGAIISEAQGKVVDTQLKVGGASLGSQVVTEIDLKAEKKILEVLRPSFDEYNLGLLTEEKEDDGSRFEKDFFWCIDPLDGTLPFSQNKSGYSVSLALVSNSGRAILGVVYDPRTEIIYYAQEGCGAYKNNELLKLTQREGKPLVIDGTGGAVLQAITTLEKAPCLFYKRPKEELGGGCLWDYAATSVIHREAGGEHSDFFGEPLKLNERASVFMNHCGVIFSAGLSEAQVQELLDRN